MNINQPYWSPLGRQPNGKPGPSSINTHGGRAPAFSERRKALLKNIQEKYKDARAVDASDGVIVLFAGLENEKNAFVQESSFYYFTGITEPGVVFCIHMDGREEIFVPDYAGKREQWVESNIRVEESVEVIKLGDPIKSYFLKPFFCYASHKNLIKSLENKTIFSLLDKKNNNYFLSIYRLENVLKNLSKESKEPKVEDISKIVASMRRKKDAHELKLMKKAVEITLGAHKHISKIISPNLHEYEIQAEVESFFIKNGAKVAFPSIVASGENTTVLHYTSLDKKLDGMLVVDIGARFNYYCADITRTYSVGGKFSSREKEIYDTVFELKKYVAKIAKPGFFLRNKEEPEKSLHHIAENFLRERGLLKYFVHGIGHFLGLDVHDVGDTKIPLGSGDVFTIEPGIYIKEERIGVRIEDDFVITESGCNVL